jgi:hypothetical protein
MDENGTFIKTGMFIKVFTFMWHHFLLIHPEAMSLFKFWRLLMFDWLLWCTQNQLVDSSFGECKCDKMFVITIPSCISHYFIFIIIFPFYFSFPLSLDQILLELPLFDYNYFLAKKMVVSNVYDAKLFLTNRTDN